jgi:chromosome segregation ATPase
LRVFLLIFCSSSFAATEQPRAVWYRYYDKNGVANVSTSVTPEHIRYGYEALDRNMQVIKRNRAYNATVDVQQSSRRESMARQREQDMRLKRAYGNTKIAATKRDQILANLKKQLNYQQEQLQQLQQDKIGFKRQEMEYHRKGETLPAQLKNNLDNNAKNIENVKRTVESLRNAYHKTETDYADIINRLKNLEQETQ